MTGAVSHRALRRMADLHAVYRMFDATGRLLYIGVTGNPSRRFKGHAEKRWYPLTSTITLQWFPTREAAERAEQRAIRSEHPKLNLQGMASLAPSWEHPTEPEPEPVPYQPRALPRKTSTPRGIRPPASPHLTTVQLSPECAEGMHGICPRIGGCQCPCDHDSKRIVAWNAAEYDRTHTQEVPA